MKFEQLLVSNNLLLKQTVTTFAINTIDNRKLIKIDKNNLSNHNRENFHIKTIYFSFRTFLLMCGYYFVQYLIHVR